MITGIRFSSFVPEPQPESPTGTPTGYVDSDQEPVVPVHNQPVDTDELPR